MPHIRTPVNVTLHGNLMTRTIIFSFVVASHSFIFSVLLLPQPQYKLINNVKKKKIEVNEQIEHTHKVLGVTIIIRRGE